LQLIGEAKHRGEIDPKYIILRTGNRWMGLAHLDTATILSSSRHYAQTAPLALIKVPMSSTLTVWYNTKCPVCNAGIAWQHGRLVRAARAGMIEFRDINLAPDVLSRFGAGIEDVRRRLHAVDAEGRLHAGVDCAIAIWLRTPGDVWLGRALSLPVIRPIARIGYDRFADLLYAWNRWQGHW
jgi:predicted DCC family thiol-disulfide oxidoreductase YuxK